VFVVLDGATPLRAMVLDLEGVSFIDSQGAAKLAEICQLLETEGVVLRTARMKPPCSPCCAPTASSTSWGKNVGNVYRAVRAQLDDTSSD
jgi:hypothetical protein